MKIPAIDLGKFNSVACDFDSSNGEHRFTTLPTLPAAMHDLLIEREPDRVVIELGSRHESFAKLCGSSRFAVASRRSPSRVSRTSDRGDSLHHRTRHGSPGTASGDC